MKRRPRAKSLPDREQVVTAVGPASFRLFVEEAWPIVVPAEPFQGNRHIDAICEHLEAIAQGQIFNLLINIPPRFGKSTITSVMFPAWLWLREPTFRLLYSSYAQSLSTRDSVATRQLIESPWYQAHWGSLFQIATDQNEKTRFENDKKGYRLATSVGGANTGEGGDVIVVDDPHNVKEAESDRVRAETIRWWNEVMSTRGNNPKTTRRIVIMQRVHEDDLAGDILAKGGYVHLNLPMEFESKFATTTAIGWQDPRQEDGQLLWPARYDATAIEELKKRLGSYAYAAQMQQRPAPLEGGMFPPKWWKYYTTDPAVLLEKANDKCWSWDMAFKDLDESDYVVGQAWVRIDADFYLLDQIRGRFSFSKTKAAVKMSAMKFGGKISAKLVEDKANGTAVMDDLKHAVGGLLAVRPEGGKQARASVVQPYAEAGNIYLPDKSMAPWVEDFISELQTFPNGAHDDQVDAMSQAIVWLTRRVNRKSEVYVDVVRKCWNPYLTQPRYRDPRYGDEPF